MNIPKYSEVTTSRSISLDICLIRTLKGVENSVLDRGVSLLEGFFLTDITTSVKESDVLIRGVSC